MRPPNSGLRRITLHRLARLECTTDALLFAPGQEVPAGKLRPLSNSHVSVHHRPMADECSAVDHAIMGNKGAIADTAEVSDWGNPRETLHERSGRRRDPQCAAGRTCHR